VTSLALETWSVSCEGKRFEEREVQPRVASVDISAQIGRAEFLTRTICGRWYAPSYSHHAGRTRPSKPLSDPPAMPMCTDPRIWHGSDKILRILSIHWKPVPCRTALDSAQRRHILSADKNIGTFCFASETLMRGYFRRFQLRHCFMRIDV
jgi:hypothetical protein